MACDAAKGRKHICGDNAGGVRNFYIVNFIENLEDRATIAGAEITALDGNTTPAVTDLYKYELRSTGHGYEEQEQGERSTGSKFFAGTFTAMLKRQDAATTDELTTVSYGTPHLIVEDENGALRLMGIRNGVHFLFNTNTGTAMGEMNGYTINATSEEKRPAYFIDPAVLDDPAQVNIIEGTQV